MKKKPQKDIDVVELMTKIQEQLAVLDRKLDTFMTKSLTELAQAMPAVKSFVVQPAQTSVGGGNRQADHRAPRPMYRATCADCKKECEIPFKPSGDRPVYCKECFARRKSGHTFKPTPAHKPEPTPLLSPINNVASEVSKSTAKEKKKTAAVKKSVAKKKVVAKKKTVKKK